MKKRFLSLILVVCLLLSAVPFAFAAEVPGSFDVYLAMNKLRAEYPEGMPWNNDNIYQWNGGIFTHGAGCAGFAFILSDAAFGNLPARKLTGVSADDLRPGDILRLNGDTHSVIVLQNTYYGIVVAEGNYNASIHWDRVISRADAESADYVLTRYPEGWVDSAPANPILESAQITNQLNWMERSYPQGMHWGYNYSYNWQGGILNGSAGSYAFAMLLSDVVFSNLPACTKQGLTLEDVRVGDIVVDKNGGAGIVVEKLGDRIRLAEGQDGGIVNWQKTMNASDMALSLMTITRYPDSQAEAGEKSLEQQAQDAMNAMREQYPEGKKWGAGDSYTWNGRPNETGSGCVGFAYILSDGAFGDLPAWERTDFELEDVRAGDILKIDGYTVIVLETYDDAVMIAEGEYNGGIHWGRYLSRAEVESAECMLTRYPADYKDPNQTVTIYQPSGNVIDNGACGYKGAPVYWKVTDEGTLLIYGVGVTDNYNYNMNYNLPPWTYYADSITQVVIQEGISGLGTQTLAYLPNLTNVTLPTTLEKIDTDCFVGCRSLEYIRLPEGLREIGNRAFQGLTGLKYINFPSTLTRIGENCFERSGLVVAELKEGIHTLGSYAFADCDNLTTAVLPGSLGSDGPQCVFQYCDKLSLLTLGEGITELGRSFAEGCDSLQEIKFPSTLTHIYKNAFDSTGLLELTLPASLEHLGDRAFAGCAYLTTVNIPYNVAEFGDYVFSNDDALTDVHIGPDVTYIGKGTFRGCDGLDVVRVPGSLGRVELYQFSETYDGGPVVAILEEGITSIAKFAFMQASNLKEVHLPASLQVIEEGAFNWNADFWEMTFYYYGTPEQWAQVEVQANNYSMDGANFIFAETMECHHTVTKTFPGVEPTCSTTGLTTGQVCKICDAVLAPQAEIPKTDHSYENLACIWCGAADPRPMDTVIASGSCGSNVTWKLQIDGTMIISGSGKMKDYAADADHPGNGYEDQITNVVIEAGVTSIGSCAFWACKKIETVTIGPDVQTIGDSAFNSCTSLKEIVIPEKVQSIGSKSAAFHNCTSLEKVEIKNGNVYLGSWCFSNLEKLETVIIAPGNISMHINNPFDGTPYLQNAMDQNGFVVMGEYLLYYGGTNPEPVIPAGVKYLESNAFSDNQNLQKIVIPEGVTTIGQWCFAYCFNLQEVVIPGSMQTIGGYAFYLKGQGKSFTFLGNRPSMTGDTFNNTTAEVFYPAGNETWNGGLSNYGGTLTWTAVEMGPCTHSKTRVIPGVAATCLEAGLSDGLACANCGVVVEEQAKVPALGHAWAGEHCSRCGEQKPAGILGDVDGNGKLTYNDALMILRYSIKLTTLKNPELADMDGNGRVDYNDALKVLRVSIGLK